MADAYVPPRVWAAKPSDNPFANINRPIAGPTHEAELPIGRHPFQLHSLGTPNGKKVTIMFEELLEAGHPADYDAWLIDIMRGDQFSTGFVAANPNSKIPALIDRSGPAPVRVFESGSILLYLADKFGAFIPAATAARAECLSWLFWQMAGQPFISGGFGHFYHYAPVKIEYAIDRYAMETKRLLDVANRRLGEAEYFAGDTYTIADMAVFPWYVGLMAGTTYGGAGEFLSLGDYANIARWIDTVGARPAVQRGLLVNDRNVMPERHEASDFDAIVREEAE